MLPPANGRVDSLRQMTNGKGNNTECADFQNLAK